MKTSISCYRSDDEIRALVESFESCILLPDDLDHRAHLAVAVWYLSSMTVEQATKRMRECLLRFIAHNGVDSQKYNETITQFWIKRLDKLMHAADPARSLAEIANQTIEEAGDSQVIFDYYTRERVFSEEARERWVEPDMKRLDS